MSRREFLHSSIGAVTAFSIPAYSCEQGGVWGVSHEGLYTDRFTYREDEDINVHCSLRSGAPVLFEFVRLDSRNQAVTHSAWGNPVNFGNPSPGLYGAMYTVAVTIPASEFAPGVYMVRMPPSAMFVQNRINSTNGFPSHNSIAIFVVTPRIPGSRSRILWVHDSLTGTAYGAFGDRSIYGVGQSHAHTVTFDRPGLDRGAFWWGGNCLPFLRDHGYDFEFIDLVDLAAVAPEYLDSFDLVCFVGQFEYMPSAVIDSAAAFQKGGGNLFVASHEFGIFRVRLNPSQKLMTAYKWNYRDQDPLYLSGNPEHAPLIAGIGMNTAEGLYETELIGQTVWPAHRVSAIDIVSLPVYGFAEAGWILEGTGIGPGDALPDAFNEFASGLCLEFSNGQPHPILADEMRLPEGLIVWGALPSSDGIDWRSAPWTPTWEWPALHFGHATATLQTRGSGSQTVTLPTPIMADWKIGVGFPVYDRLLLNIFSRLSVRSS